MGNDDYFIKQDIGCFFMGKNDVVILTENVDGEKYALIADSIHTVLDDWENECDCVPENDAPVYFVMSEGEIYSRTFGTFEDLMEYFKVLRHEDC